MISLSLMTTLSVVTIAISPVRVLCTGTLVGDLDQALTLLGIELAGQRDVTGNDESAIGVGARSA